MLISADPETILVDYASAYSVVPGRINVTDLRIRGRDSNVEWILGLDRCDFRVYVADFFHRRFHADEVHGDGLTLRVRRRRPAFTPDEAAALPPVPGFSDPPYAGAASPPIADADYHLWSVWLEGVVANHVREIWVDTLRSSGDLQIRGRWYFKPVRWLEVGPAAVDVRHLDVSWGADEPWVTGATGRLLVTVHPGDVRSYTGGGLFEYVSLSGPLSGTLQASTIANRVAKDQRVAVSPLEVPFALDAGDRPRRAARRYEGAGGPRQGDGARARAGLHVGS